MNEFRAAGIFYEQRGPLVLSAILHLVLLVVFAISLLISPPKKPEELVFEIVSPPGPQADVPRPTLQQLEYESENVEMPTEDEIVLPERPMIPVPAPEPVVEEAPPEESIVVKPPPKKAVPEAKPEPKPQPMSLEEFQKKFGPIKPSNVPKPTKPEDRRVKVELSDLAKNLNEFQIDSLPSAQISASSVSSQQTLESYLAGFRATVRRNLEDHPFSGRELVAKVQCDISANGYVSNARVVVSSGDPVFDKKALDAFKRIRVFQAPPDNRGFTGLRFDLVQK